MTRRHRAEWMMSLAFSLALLTFVLYYGWSLWGNPTNAPAAPDEPPEQAFMAAVARHELGAVRVGAGDATVYITREFVAMAPAAQKRTLSTAWHYCREKQPETRIVNVVDWGAKPVGTFDGRTFRQ